VNSFLELLEIVRRLRAPDGCPWDREQTFRSLTPHIIEEAYELVEAIEADDFSHMKEEMGDVLLHVVMLAAMAEEEGRFSVDDVARDVSEKMVRRHPHVFGDKKLDTVDEVWDQWDLIKKEEKDKTLSESVPKGLPALLQASKVQKKVSRLGHDWGDVGGDFDVVGEKLLGIRAVLESDQRDVDALESEFGAVFFGLVQIAREMGVDPEASLNLTSLQ